MGKHSRTGQQIAAVGLSASLPSLSWLAAEAATWKMPQPHMQRRDCGSWSSWPWPQRHLARHVCTLKPLRRGNHQSPTSSGLHVGTQQRGMNVSC